MKNILLTALLVITSLTLLVENSLAAEPATYPNQVNVSIHTNKNVTLTLNGYYQIYNKQTKNITMIAPGTTISFSNNGTSIIVTFSNFSQSSTTGFDVQELSGTDKLAAFTSQTEMRKGADTSYETVYTLKVGESANYLTEFSNKTTGEKWFRISTGSYIGWVPSKYVKLIDSPGTSLTKASNGSTYRGSFSINRSGNSVEVINKLDMEDYLKGVVPNEMPASWHREALKAQAIAARSFAANSMTLSSTTSSQVYKGYSGEDSRTNAAIKETEGLLVKYNGKPIQTFFHSTSGGRTANIGDVWNSNQSSFPYLVSVADPYEISPYSSWKEQFTASTVLSSFGFKDTAKLLDINLETKGANGEVTAITVKTTDGEKTIRGNENTIRRLFPLSNNRYLYSNWFKVDFNKSTPAFSVQTSTSTLPLTQIKGQKVQTSQGEMVLPDDYISVQTATGVIASEVITSINLNGKGFGHRIGMSQYGAKSLAEKGWTAEQIIKHYFTGTTISK